MYVYYLWFIRRHIHKYTNEYLFSWLSSVGFSGPLTIMDLKNDWLLNLAA